MRMIAAAFAFLGSLLFVADRVNDIDNNEQDTAYHDARYEMSMRSSSTNYNIFYPNVNGVDFTEVMRETYGRCGEYHDLALSVGWPEEEWPTLSMIMQRESNCQPTAWNGSDAGLTQINRIHTEWLAEMGWSHPDDMFNPESNLTFAYRLWSASGWKPWSFSGPVPK